MKRCVFDKLQKQCSASDMKSTVDLALLENETQCLALMRETGHVWVDGRGLAVDSVTMRQTRFATLGDESVLHANHTTLASPPRPLVRPSRTNPPTIVRLVQTFP